MYPENPEGTQVIVGSMNMGYISDTARNQTHNLFRPKREPIPLGHSDGQDKLYKITSWNFSPKSKQILKICPPQRKIFWKGPVSTIDALSLSKRRLILTQFKQKFDTFSSIHTIKNGSRLSYNNNTANCMHVVNRLQCLSFSVFGYCFSLRLTSNSKSLWRNWLKDIEDNVKVNRQCIL